MQADVIWQLVYETQVSGALFFRVFHMCDMQIGESVKNVNSSLSYLSQVTNTGCM